jgi:hypothetical protein
MKKRTVAGTIVTAAIAIWATRFMLKIAEELRRYDHIRSLSNEGPVMEETPDIALQVMREQQQTVKEWMQFLMRFPKDAARYIKIESM